MDGEADALPTKRRAGTGPAGTVLDLDTAGFYRPRTKETRAAYEALMNSIHQQFGDQPQVWQATFESDVSTAISRACIGLLASSTANPASCQASFTCCKQATLSLLLYATMRLPCCLPP